MDWLHIVAVIALVIIGVVMYVNKRKTMMVAWLTIATAAWGNDGVLYVNGNHLVPIQETDIALTKEVLTITLCDDGYASVDVQYLLTNNGKEKTVTMGFEAEAPYNDYDVNFKPVGNMLIESAERMHYDDFKLGTFYDRSDRYLPGSFQIEMNHSASQRRILKNLPYANRGYVFKDKKLQKYFSQFFWYMPDPSWQANTADFTPREWKLINEGE